MKENTNPKTFEQIDSGFGDHEPRSGPAERPRARARGRTNQCAIVYTRQQTKVTVSLMRRNSMALSVTRHASNPYRAKENRPVSSIGHAGRELVGFDNSLPESLPEKDQRYQYVLGVVGFGRLSAHGYPPSSSLKASVLIHG